MFDHLQAKNWGSKVNDLQTNESSFMQNFAHCIRDVLSRIRNEILLFFWISAKLYEAE